MFPKYLLLTVFFLLIAPGSVFATSYDVDIIATVEGCGDQLIQNGEQCDGLNLGGSSCSLLGFDSGSLACSSVCTFDTSMCALDDDLGGPTNGGTRISLNKNDPQDSNVVISGYFNPNSLVSILKDGITSGVTFTNDLGFWQITLSGLNPRTYIFQISGSTSNNSKVNSEVFFIEVIKGTTVKVSNVILPPKFLVSETQNELFIEGNGVPDANINIYIDDVFVSESTINSEGEFNVLLSNKYSDQDHSISIEMTFAGAKVMSRPVIFKSKNNLPELDGCASFADATNDCKVNFIDFNLMLRSYFYEPVRAIFDLNKNGKVDLVDFSILAYFWTG